MPRLTLAERLQRAAQKRSPGRTGRSPATDDTAQMRTRGLIQMGGLVVKAGLDELPPTALYAALLRIAAEVKDPATIALYAKAHVISRRKRTRGSPPWLGSRRWLSAIWRPLYASSVSAGTASLSNGKARSISRRRNRPLRPQAASIQPVRPGGPAVPRQAPTPG